MSVNTVSITKIANRYHLLEKLGAGGMGAVYRTRDHLTRQIVALKQVIAPLDRLHPSTRNSEPLLALAVEFRTLAGLRHPNIISVLDYGFDETGQPFFTMELLSESQTIRQAAQNQPIETKIRLINEMLLALAYLHRRGVIHRDLKPENVLVTASGQVKVLDFGLASGATTESVTGLTQEIVGTMAYMAPELFADQPASVQSDLYAVGMIAYEIFVGGHPFATKNLAALLYDIMTTMPDTSKLEFDLGSLLDHLLAKNPDDRPRDAEQVMRGLCEATQQPLPQESAIIRESFLQASKFVGRDPELEHLKTRLEQMIEGETHFILIGGESGVGKSRLVDELRIRALVKGTMVLRGQAVAEGGVPFQLWVEPLRRLILSTTLSDLEAGILKELVPDIGELLGREVQPAPEITGGAWQQRLILTIVEVFKRPTKPVILILEDLHWSAESLAVLRQLLNVRDQLASLLVVGTYRDDEKPELSQELAEMQHLSLRRLDAAAIADLSESMLGETGKQSHVVDLLQRETEGNAFFMVEVVRTLAEDAGSLAEIGRMTLPKQILAGGVQRIVQQRLNRLPELIQNWLKPIAVAGRQLDLTVVHRYSITYFSQGVIVQGEVEAEKTAIASAVMHSIADEFLVLCANAAVLEVADGVWRFSHDKIRETLLAELPKEERAALHRQVAEAVEAVYPRDERYYEALLEHWHQAGDLDKEIPYLEAVVEHLVDFTADYIQARILVNRGLERLTEQDNRRISLLNWLSQTYLKQGDYTQCQHIAQQALELAKQVGDQQAIATSLNNLGINLGSQGDYAQAKGYFEQSLAIKRAIDDQPGIASSLNNLGIVAWSQGDYAQAQDYAQESLTIRQALEDQAGISASLSNLGILSAIQGDHAQAETYNQQSLTIRRTIGDQAGIANSLGNLGISAISLGDYARAQSHLQEALSIQQAIGDKWGVARSVNTLGIIAWRQSDYTQARDYFEQSLTMFQAMGNQGSSANNLVNLGFVYLKLQPELAPSAFHQALTLSYAMQAVVLIVETILGFALLRFRAGKSVQARKLAGLTAHHPAANGNADIQWRLKEVLPELQATLSADELAAAMERGKAFDLDTVVAELLEEFGENRV